MIMPVQAIAVTSQVKNFNVIVCTNCALMCGTDVNGCLTEQQPEELTVTDDYVKETCKKNQVAEKDCELLNS